MRPARPAVCNPATHACRPGLLRSSTSLLPAWCLMTARPGSFLQLLGVRRDRAGDHPDDLIAGRVFRFAHSHDPAQPHHLDAVCEFEDEFQVVTDADDGASVLA